MARGSVVPLDVVYGFFDCWHVAVHQMVVFDAGVFEKQTRSPALLEFLKVLHLKWQSVQLYQST